MIRKTKLQRFIPTAPSIKRHFKNTEFPSDWATPHLDDLIDELAPICYGILMPGDHVPNGIPVIKVKDYVNGTLSRDKVLCTSVEIDSQYNRSRVREGDILLSIRGGTGAIRFVPKELDGANITQDTARLRASPVVDSGYLAKSLEGSFVQTQIQLDTIGQAVTGINIGSVRKLVIPLPSLPEQRKIADILTTWDEALTQLDALIEVQERRKKALMQQLLTGRRRLKGFSKPWITAKLGSLFKERVEQGRMDLPLLSITADRGIVPREEVAKRDSSSEDKSKYLRIAPGDIGYNTMRMWQGVSALSALEGIVSPAYTICTPTDCIDGRFAAHFFKLRHTVHLFHRYSQGLVDDTLNLKFPSFAVIELSIPSDLEEQRQIAAILDTADQQLTLLHTQRTALDQQKRGLMQRLLTGRVRVVAE